MKRKDFAAFLSGIRRQRTAATDETALESMAVYPYWREGETYANGDRVRYADKLWKYVGAAQSTAIAAWNPAAAPSLWAEVLPGQDGAAVDEWVQPDSTNPYKYGDRVMHNGKLWESIFDGDNVWEPGVFGWTEVV